MEVVFAEYAKTRSAYGIIYRAYSAASFGDAETRMNQKLFYWEPAKALQAT